MLTRIDHVGIAVKSLQDAKKLYSNVMGLTLTGEEEIDQQKVKVAFFSIGDTHIELLEPTADDSPIRKFLNKNGEGLHHIAYQTDDIQNELEKAKKEGCKLINEQPIDGGHGKKIAFLHPKSTNGVLIEYIFF